MFQEMCSYKFLVLQYKLYPHTNEKISYLSVSSRVLQSKRCLLFVSKGGYFSGCVEGCFVGGRTLVQTGVVNDDQCSWMLYMHVSLANSFSVIVWMPLL